MPKRRKKTEETRVGKSETSEATRPGYRPYFWVAIPFVWVVLLLAAEGALRLGGYGVASRLFDPVEPSLLADNEGYTARFYPSAEEYVPVQKTNLFTRERRTGRLRIFVVGGSTAQGYPFQRNHSFSAMAQAGLRAIGVDAEIINIGNSAMSSYYVREVLGELPSYQPDMVAIYAGHNEYYGTPSSFTGGSHRLRLALLELKRLRLVQLAGRMVGAIASIGGDEGPSSTMMEQRFSQATFPLDSARDEDVATLFVRNLDDGLRPLVDAGVSAVIFEPVSNLVSMPPFRSGSGDSNSPTAQAGGGSSLEAYRRQSEELEAGRWDRAAWEEAKDLDDVPFRARSTLVRALERYVRESPAITWIPTASELERQLGPAAFSDSLFIDHLHFNFEGQRLLGEMLARAVVETFHAGDPARLSALQAYFADRARVRSDIHLTDFWEFEAYTRITSMQAREPFASMSLPKEPVHVPERLGQNSLFAGGGFVQALQGASADDLFYIALDHYRVNDRDEWIRNLNAYVHLFPGHYQSHVAYGVALLEDDPLANLEGAGRYFRRAYGISGRNPEVVESARETFEGLGMDGVWDSFRATYLE